MWTAVPVPRKPSRPPLFGLPRIRQLVVGNQERSPWLEVPIGSSQCFSIVITPTANAKGAADEDGPIASSEVELVQRRDGQLALEPGLGHLRRSQSDHVCRDV